VSLTGADLLVSGLRDVDVEVAFGLPGVHNLPAWEILRQSRIRLVGVRHEQTAVYAADGFARASGRVGVALVTTGPGAANTLGACGEAWASRSPVVVIATDVPTRLRRDGVVRSSLHECADQTAMFAPVTKATLRAETSRDLDELARNAVQLASAAPCRPVYLEVPTDLLGEIDTPPGGSRTTTLHASGAPDLGAALDAIATARSPIIWAGGGALHADAGEAVGALASKLCAPVITTYSARGLLGDHPCAVGLPPHVPEVGALWDSADVVVAIGSDLDGMMTQNWALPKPPTLIAINVDPDDAAKNYEPDVLLVGDAREVTAALVAALPGRDDDGEEFGARLELLRVKVDGRLRSEHPEEMAFLDAFSAAVPDETVVFADMCIPGYWLAGFHRVPAPRKLAYPMGWGTLGFGFPASIGAALAGSGPVVSVSGDGGFLFACGELATVAQEKLPMTIVIVDDGGYGMLRFDQQLAGHETYGVDLVTPDYVALAQSFGIRAQAVEGLADEFSAALAEHVASDEPSVLVARAALEPPPTTSPRWYRRG
jgi:thiamine pyrophosphate-dependent acetolactate synthase large subunit-like protein